jgi:hypothetical protein
MEYQFLTLQKAQALENTIAFLREYKGPENDSIMHLIGPSTNPEEADQYYTKQLRRLAEINIERENILNLFK